MVTKHFCFPLFLPVPPSELWDTSSKSSMIIIYGTFLLHFLQKISASGREAEEENSERTHESHPLWPLGCHGSSGEKQTCKPPNILHLRTLLKAETGKCLALRVSELPCIIFLICQLNSQETGIIQKKERTQPRMGNYFNCLIKPKIQRTITRGNFGGEIGNFSLEIFLLKVMGIKIYHLTLDQL